MPAEELPVAAHGITGDLTHLATPLEDLDMLEGNPRRGDVEAVARSYARFGQRKAIVARRRDGGRLEVLAGNHQLAAARALGWSHIAVVVVDDDDTTAKAFALADNRTSDLGDYDPEALAAMLTEVAAADADMLAATSYSLDDVARLVVGQGPMVPDPDLEDVPPPPAEPYTRPGDLWLLGAHRLVCGDSADPKALDVALEGRTADLVFTSPPYNVGVGYDSHDDRPVPWPAYAEFLASVLRPVVDRLGAGRALCWNIGTSPKTFPARQQVLLEDLGLDYLRTLVWRKVGVPVPTWYNTRNDPVARRFTPNYTHEVVLVFAAGDAPGEGVDPDPEAALAAFVRRPFDPTPAHELVVVYGKGDLERGDAVRFSNLLEHDVFELPQHMATRDLPTDASKGFTGAQSNLERRSRKAHPAPFPVALPEAFVDHLADVGTVVLDPFAGAGSTLLAAMRSGRLGVGVEIDPGYCDVAVARWQRVTGDTPRLVRGRGKPKAVDLAAELGGGSDR